MDEAALAAGATARGPGVPWTARRSSQSILKEIGPEYSLEGLILKLKLQYTEELIHRGTILKLLVKSRLPSKISSASLPVICFVKKELARNQQAAAGAH